MEGGPTGSATVPRLGRVGSRESGIITCVSRTKLESGPSERVHQFDGHPRLIQTVHSLTGSTHRGHSAWMECTLSGGGASRRRLRSAIGEHGREKPHRLHELTPQSRLPWQRSKIIRLDDSCLYFVNGKLAGASDQHPRSPTRHREPLWSYRPSSSGSDRRSGSVPQHRGPRDQRAAAGSCRTRRMAAAVQRQRPDRGDRRDSGKAEIAMEDGQPTLRLTEPVTLSHPPIGDYHLRFEYQPSPGQHGGGLHLIGQSNRLSLRWAISSERTSWETESHIW